MPDDDVWYLLELDLWVHYNETAKARARAMAKAKAMAKAQASPPSGSSPPFDMDGWSGSSPPSDMDV